MACNLQTQKSKFAVRRPTGLAENEFSEERDSMRKQKGFSLIELLIVVAIILIIAAIAIPNLLRARIAANDSAAASTIRTINTAEVTFSTTYVSSGYAPTLQALGPNGTACAAPTATGACLVDDQVGCAATKCPKGGYNFYMTATTTTAPVPDYTASAGPFSNGTGSMNYCSNPDAVVRFNKSTTVLAGAETGANCASLGTSPFTVAGKYNALQ
jgi:type IV pilus assembly protein PilA